MQVEDSETDDWYISFIFDVGSAIIDNIVLTGSPTIAKLNSYKSFIKRGFLPTSSFKIPNQLPVDSDQDWNDEIVTTCTQKIQELFQDIRYEVRRFTDHYHTIFFQYESISI
jgi:hypothetical protein